MFYPTQHRVTMPDIEQTVLKTVKDHQLFDQKHHLIVAVSGGPDSTCLLHLLRQLFAALNLTAVYVDHQLRPAESSAEKKLIEAHCRRLGAVFLSASVDVPGEYARTGESLEACGRRLRYQALEEIRQTRRAERIAVGHTADDQVEEVLLRLIRGSGLKGLSGMRYRNGALIRPLLDINKDQVLSYLDGRGLSSCTDSTNFSTRFLRNRIRHELLPMLESTFNPSIRKTIFRTAKLLGNEEDYMRREAARLFEKARIPGSPAERRRHGQMEIDVKTLAAAHPALRKRVIERLCWEMGSRPDHRSIASVDTLLQSGATGAELHLPDRLRVVRQRDTLLFALLEKHRSRRARFADPAPYDIEIPAPGVYRLAEEGVSVSIEVADRRVDPQPGISVMDGALISFPLRLRSLQPGDRFIPLGAPGRKRVARFLADRKVAAHRRGRYPVLVSGDTIVCVVGLEIDERYRVTDGTKRTLLVSVAENLPA